MNEIYIVVDIETDGQIPSDSSMLTMGAVVMALDLDDPGTVDISFNEDGTFYRRLYRRIGAVGHKETLAWWAEQDPAARNEAFYTEPRHKPADAMRDFQTWTKEQMMKHKADGVVFVARPTGFDFSFVRWYMEHYIGSSEPFGHRALDLRSMWFGMEPETMFNDLSSNVMDVEFGSVVEVVKDLGLRPHYALDDAKHHALIFADMLRTRSMMQQSKEQA